MPSPRCPMSTGPSLALAYVAPDLGRVVLPAARPDALRARGRPRCAAGPPGDAVLALRRLARRALISLVGTAAVVAGLAMLVLPGPGLLTIALGLGFLGREYTWAARLHDDVRARLVAAGRTVRAQVRRDDDERPASIP